MNRLVVLLAFVPFFSLSQPGIRFEKNLSWTAIQAKAKKEHKYIFVDCYASWCGPCKMMEKSTYTDPTVAEVFNKNFISVKYQMDSTGSDNDEIKSHYADAQQIEQKYPINAYPSFLFFDPNGKIVHKAVGFQNPEAFIELEKNSMMTDCQYYSLLDYTRTGKITPDQVNTLAIEAQAIGEQKVADSNARIYFAYLDKLPNDSLFTFGRISFISAFTGRTTDKYFPFFLQNEERVNKIMNNANYAGSLLDNIIIAEDIGLYSSWSNISAVLTTKYGAKASDRAITKAKILFYYGKDWPVFCTAMVHYTETYEDKSNREIMQRNANYIFLNSASTEEKRIAASWLVPVNK